MRCGTKQVYEKRNGKKKWWSGRREGVLKQISSLFYNQPLILVFSILDYTKVHCSAPSFFATKTNTMQRISIQDYVAVTRFGECLAAYYWLKFRTKAPCHTRKHFSSCYVPLHSVPKSLIGHPFRKRWNSRGNSWKRKLTANFIPCR